MTELDKTASPTALLKPWSEPRVEILDVAESRIFGGRGHDGSTFPNSTRS